MHFDQVSHRMPSSSHFASYVSLLPAPQVLQQEVQPSFSTHLAQCAIETGPPCKFRATTQRFPKLQHEPPCLVLMILDNPQTRLVRQTCIHACIQHSLQLEPRMTVVSFVALSHLLILLKLQYFVKRGSHRGFRRSSWLSARAALTIHACGVRSAALEPKRSCSMAGMCRAIVPEE